jgi:UDP-N-acetylglucosamine 4,6-dehydratase
MGHRYFVSGGTGSLGSALVRHLLKDDETERVVVFSRDEQKQFRMASELNDDRLRFFLGDVRDATRVRQIMEGSDTVIHTAALKIVPLGEVNPFEVVATNVVGTENILNAALDCGVKRTITVSSDKGCLPINLYGGTKLVAEKLTINANFFRGSRDAMFSAIRYGNAFDSRGSVARTWLRRWRKGLGLPITDLAMTRFHLRLSDAVSYIVVFLDTMLGGEIFVPVLPAYRLAKLVDAFAEVVRGKGVPASFYDLGIRPGEKMHEVLVSEHEVGRAVRTLDGTLVLPAKEICEQYDMAVGEYHSRPKLKQPVSSDNALPVSKDTLVEDFRRLMDEEDHHRGGSG